MPYPRALLHLQKGTGCIDTSLTPCQKPLTAFCAVLLTHKVVKKFTTIIFSILNQ